MKSRALTISLLYVFVLFATTIFVLKPGLIGPLVYDDYPNLSRLLTENVNYNAAIFENTSGPFGRSITMATFAVNHWLKDSLVVFDLKLSNLLIHLLNGLLVFWLIYSLLKIKLTIDKARTCSIMVTGLWMLTPVNTETVLYVIQRATLLSTTFMLIASIAYVRLRQACNTFNFQTLFFFFILLACWVIAMLCKENAVLLPLIILCIEVCFFDYFNFNTVRQKTIIFLSLSLLIFMVVIILFADSQGFLNYSNRGFTLQERVFTQPVILMVYLKELLFPQSVNVGLFWDDFQTRKVFFNITTILSLLFIVILIAASIINLRNKHYKYISAGVLIFFCGHLLESTIFPLELFFRHRNYFPSIGVYLFLILLIDRLLLSYKAEKILISFFIIYCGLFSLGSYKQSQVWSSFHTILLNGYEKHPESLRANLEIIGALAIQGDLAGSLEVGNKMIASRPAEALPVKIQRLYLYCELANEIPEQEYRLLQSDLNLTHPILISAALNKFMMSYKARHCDFIDVRRIVDSFSSWVDQQLATGQQTATQLWSIDYYLIEFLLLLDEKDEALARLESQIHRGNSKANHFKELLLNSDHSLKN